MHHPSPDLHSSTDPQHQALADLYSPRLYFVAQAPAEVRPTLPAEQGGLCIYNIASASPDVFEAFIKACAKTAIAPLAFTREEYSRLSKGQLSRRLVLQRLVTAGAQVPVFAHVGTAQAAIAAQVEARRRAAQRQVAKEADLVAAIMNESGGVEQKEGRR